MEGKEKIEDFFLKNKIKIKWRNEKPMEPRSLLGVLCLENDKKKKRKCASPCTQWKKSRNKGKLQ
jgi:hypothetical protein